MEETAKAHKNERWSGGQPRADYYDKHGRRHTLPADPYSVEHYMGRGLRLHPPESPTPISVPASVLDTRQTKTADAPAEIETKLIVSNASPPRKRRAKKGKK